MNQILVSQKLYVTPDMKKKKKAFKFDSFYLFFCYAYYLLMQFMQSMIETRVKRYKRNFTRNSFPRYNKTCG